jgi:septum formation protein
VSSKRLILASGSPRRAELLKQIGLDFEVSVPDVDETPLPDETPETYVLRMARIKAAAVHPDAEEVVLAADTVVVLDGRILGKPAGRAEGVAMLRALGGREHQVLTAIAGRSADAQASELVITRVRFVPVDESLAEAYWATGEGSDKAGSYGIQGIGGILAESITGSYSAVVGLPLPETERLLGGLGVDTWKRRQL